MKDLTLAIVDCKDYELAKRAFDHCVSIFSFEKKIFLTDEKDDENKFIVPIDKISSIEEYSEFILRSLYRYVKTSHVLLIQWDGFIVDPRKWTMKFMEYDYIGAPWFPSMLKENVPKEFVVGNGGFSLRSRNLLETTSRLYQKLKKDKAEDVTICQLNRTMLEENEMKFAPLELAKRFSFESGEFEINSFGSHARILIDENGSLFRRF